MKADSDSDISSHAWSWLWTHEHFIIFHDFSIFEKHADIFGFYKKYANLIFFFFSLTSRFLFPLFSSNSQKKSVPGGDSLDKVNG